MPNDAAGADLVIEAVFEDPDVKAQVFAEIEPHLAEGALLASNTSTLPITGLAENVEPPRGLHRDALLLARSTGCRCWRSSAARGPRRRPPGARSTYARRIAKTPIVVNDTRGFFTSRVITPLLNEATAMLLEGIPAATIEQASSQAGYPTPLLQLSDELNLELSREDPRRRPRGGGGRGRRHGPGIPPKTCSSGCSTSSTARAGARAAASTSTRRTARAPGCGRHARRVPAGRGPVDPLAARPLERLLFIQAIEAVKCFDEGVIESVADANVGSIMGIGYPRWTGGVLQYVNGYDGGPAGFVARAQELAARYGDRFEPPSSLVERAESGERYSDELVGGAWRS